MTAGSRTRDWGRLLTQLMPENAQRYREAGHWRGERLYELVDRWAADRADVTAVVDSRGRWTYGELAKTVHAVAGALVGLGVGPGDVVACQLPNWRELNAVAVACTRIGAVFSLIAPIFRERDLGRMLALAEPAVLFTCDRFRDFDHAAMGAKLVRQVDSRPRLVVVGEPRTDGVAWEEILAEADAGIDIPGPDPSSVAQLAFTSGTSGEPKGILHTHETLMHSPRGVIERYALTQDDCQHVASTLGHQSGVLNGICSPVLLGGTVVLQDIWDADEFCRLVEREGITVTCGAIPFLSDFLASPELTRRDLSTLRLFGCFGSGLPEALATEAAARLPNCTLYGGWGMTECGLPICNPPSDSIELVCETDGVLVPGSEVQIRDAELAYEQPPGVEGELLVRGPGRHLGFLQPTLSESLFLDDDWYVTGDRGYLRADGYFVMTGRSKDIIVRGGENVPVAEVENVLLKHQAIRSVAVVAYPDERLGERACACVELSGAGPLDLDGLRDWLRTTGLTPHYWPERVEVFDALPMTPSGKIQKAELRATLAGEGTAL